MPKEELAQLKKEKGKASLGAPDEDDIAQTHSELVDALERNFKARLDLLCSALLCCASGYACSYTVTSTATSTVTVPTRVPAADASTGTGTGTAQACGDSVLGAPQLRDRRAAREARTRGARSLAVGHLSGV